MSKKPNIIEDRELTEDSRDIHDFLARDVKRWLGENKAIHKCSTERLLDLLADKIEVGPRQLRRYLDGATDIGINKAVALCNAIGLYGIFEAANYHVGLDACPLPSIPVNECDNYDVAEELIKNVKAFSKQSTVLVNALNSKKITPVLLQKIQVASHDARRQILSCQRWFEEHVKQKHLTDYRKTKSAQATREEKKREELKKAGQEDLF